MITYFTSLPMSRFSAEGDFEALSRSEAEIIYRESDDGKDFTILRGKVLMEGNEGE